MADITNWRERELNLEQVAAKYPDVPYLIILKIDIKRRGVIYTERALEAVDPEFHLVQAVNINTDEEMPGSAGIFGLGTVHLSVRLILKRIPFIVNLMSLII